MVKYTEIVLIIFILIDYLLFWFIAENRIYYIFSQQSFRTYIANVPTALIRFRIVTDKETISKYYFNLWKVF